MANIYTTPAQSQFIPTYQPISLDAVNIGAQAMQQRQEENFQRYDQFQETAREMEKQLFEEDKQLFNKKMKGVRNQLDQLAADGDLSDAGRQIRSLANQFKEQAQAGKLGTAFKNFQAVQNKYKQIDESDLSDSQKEARKRAIIADYGGVEGEGSLDLSINTDDIDINEWIDERIGDMSPSEIAKETGWTWKPTIGKFQKGNITVSQIPQQAIENVIDQSLANDPEAQSALRQRARVATAGQNEFVVQEDGESKIISRDEMVDRIVEREKNNMVQLAQTKFGDIDIDTDSEVTTPSKYATGIGGRGEAVADGYSTYVTGVSRVAEMGITDFLGGLQQIRDLEVSNEPEAAEDMRQTMNLALMSFSKDNEDISEQDVKFLKNMGEEIRKLDDEAQSSTPIGGAILSTAEGAAGRASQPRAYHFQPAKERFGEERLEKYNNLKNKFNDWIEKTGGYVQPELTFNNQNPDANNAFQRASETIQRSNPGNWRVYGEPESDEQIKDTSGLSEGARNRLDTFEFKSVVPGNEYNPTMINGYWLNEDGEEERVSLVYQRSTLAPTNAYDPVDQILNALGSKGQEILKDRRFEHIKVDTEFKNIRDQLPIRTNNEYVGLKRVPQGYQAMYGDDNDRRPFTDGALVQSIMKYSKDLERTPSEFLNMVDRKYPGVLTEEEKGFILDGNLQDSQGDEKELAQQIRRKLATQLTDPYTFNNKRVASEIAAETTL